MKAKEKIAAAIHVIEHEMMILNKTDPCDPKFTEAVNTQKKNLDRLKKLYKELEKSIPL